MKNIKIIVLVFILAVFYSYALVISNIPDKIVLFEGEQLKLGNIFGVDIGVEKDYQTVSASSSITSENTGVTKIEVSLFDKIPIKNVDVNVIPKTKVIPIGNIAGVKLYASGVLVVGMSEVKGEKPYENVDLKEGDMIVSIDEKEVASTNDLIKIVNESKGKEIEISYIRDGENLECSIKPVEMENNEYKLGLWVRDSAAGVGTVSFYEPSTKSFGALGHGITDIDTNELIDIAKGEFITTEVLSITKGEKGKPGKIQGTVQNQTDIGEIEKNTKFGIFGKVTNLSAFSLDTAKELEVATREEIQLGKATIVCSLDKKKTKEYEIEIEKIYSNNNQDNKSMMIKVTDEELLEKTGGIIQGMSGSPILQNGKFIGAVTHVLVNNPQKGYAIFGDLMIKQMRETT